MKLCGIISEYNPIHDGHLKHLRYARNASACDAVVCIMSGNFVQRGLPACADKLTRAKHAVLAGADLVVELPVWYALGSADDFAWGGMGIAKALGIDAISFGCECDDIERLKGVAHGLAFETQSASTAIKAALKSGLSYPTAVASAFPDSILSSPNNTLAVAYLKAAVIMDYQPQFYPLLRDSDYHGDDLSKGVSSTGVRNALLRGDSIDGYVPKFVVGDVDGQIEAKYRDFVYLFMQTVTAEGLRDVYGVTEGLENRILDAADRGSFEAFFDYLKTKRYTELRLKRILARCVLGITNGFMQRVKAVATSRVLAVNADMADDLMRVFSLSKLGGMSDSEALVIDRKQDKLYSALQNKRRNVDFNISTVKTDKRGH